MSFQTGILNFELITVLPSPSSSTRLTPFIAVSPPARPLAIPRVAPRPNLSSAPLVSTKPASLAPPTRDTPSNVVVSPSPLSTSEPRVAAPLSSPPLELSSSVHDANSEFASSSPRARARARALPCSGAVSPPAMVAGPA